MASLRFTLIIALTALMHLYPSTSGIEAPIVGQEIQKTEEPQPISANLSLENGIESKSVVMEDDLEKDEGAIFDPPVIKQVEQPDKKVSLPSDVKAIIEEHTAQPETNVQPVEVQTELAKNTAVNEEPKLTEDILVTQPVILNSASELLAQKEGQVSNPGVIQNDPELKTGVDKKSLPPIEDEQSLKKKIAQQIRKSLDDAKKKLLSKNAPAKAATPNAEPVVNALKPSAEEKEENSSEENSDKNDDEELVEHLIKTNKGTSQSPSRKFDVSINVFSPDDEQPKPCKVEILKAFGMTHDKPFELSKPSKADTKMYCRRNSQTCCSARHIESVMEKFTQATQKLRKSFEPIEELFTLFRGPAYANFINEASGDDTCSVYVNDAMAMIGKGPEYFFDPEHTKMRTSEILSLLVDLEFYIKRQIWFYGNMVCTICNPNENEFFTFTEKKLGIKALMNTCSDILETYEFEIRIIKLYNFFIKPIAEIIKCKAEKLADEDYLLQFIDHEILFSMEQRFNECYTNFSGENPACVQICSKHVTEFSTQADFHNLFKEALKIIFQRLAKRDIVDYYLEIKGEKFEEHSVDSIEFFHQGWGIESSQMFKDVSWEFGNHGVNIYNNHVSKKFYSFKAPKKRATSV
jgi:hypothetical protein